MKQSKPNRHARRYAARLERRTYPGGKLSAKAQRLRLARLAYEARDIRRAAAIRAAVGLT